MVWTESIVTLLISACELYIQQPLRLFADLVLCRSMIHDHSYLCSGAPKNEKFKASGKQPCTLPGLEFSLDEALPRSSPQIGV